MIHTSNIGSQLVNISTGDISTGDISRAFSLHMICMAMHSYLPVHCSGCTHLPVILSPIVGGGQTHPSQKRTQLLLPGLKQS